MSKRDIVERLGLMTASQCGHRDHCLSSAVTAKGGKPVWLRQAAEHQANIDTLVEVQKQLSAAKSAPTKAEEVCEVAKNLVALCKISGLNCVERNIALSDTRALLIKAVQKL